MGEGGVTEPERGADVLDAVPIGVMKVDRDWRVTYLNAAGAAVVGYTPAELVGTDYFQAFPANVEGSFGPAFREVMAGRRPAVVEAVYPAPLNAWFEVQTIPADDGGLDFYFSDVTVRRQAQDRLAVLAGVSAELAGALDLDAAAARVPQLVVPALADWCILTLIDGSGRPRDVGWEHRDPARLPLVERYATARMDSLPAHAPVARVLRGEADSAASGASMVELLPPGPAKDALRELAPGHGAALGLRGRGRTQIGRAHV